MPDRARSPTESPSRRVVLGGLAAGALAVAAPAQASGSPVAFVAIGDWGKKGARIQRQVAEAMADVAAEVASRFALSVGDNFYPAGVASVTDPHWKASFEDVYTAGSLQTPWYVALGNHDYRGSPQAQLDYARGSDRWRMPARYFTVTGAEIGAPDLDIFVLDTSPMVMGVHEAAEQLRYGHLELRPRERQLAWLEQALSRSTALWKIVVGHHPVYSGGAHNGEPFLAARLPPLLQRHGVQLYLNGHDHDLQHIERQGVNYVCTGAGADSRPVKAIDGTRFCSERPGFSVLKLDGDRLDIEFRDQAAASLYRTSLSRQTL